MNPDAVDAIVEETRGYPYFIQEWGSQLWNFIEREPITTRDVKSVRNAVWDSLDANFFRMRMERVTPSEREFILAMADVSVDDAPCRITDVANHLGIRLNAIGPRRSSLKKKGVIYSPSHGMIAFTVPMFSGYLQRTR